MKNREASCIEGNIICSEKNHQEGSESYSLKSEVSVRTLNLYYNRSTISLDLSYNQLIKLCDTYTYLQYGFMTLALMTLPFLEIWIANGGMSEEQVSGCQGQ